MKLIILDRDGVINYDSEVYIKSPEEWLPIPGSLEAIARLKQAGYYIAVATNQSGIARGLYDVETLDKIHQKMQLALATFNATVDMIAYCPHHPDEQCGCRKPKPGLLTHIAKQLHVDLKDVPLIGDSLRDVQAAQAVGCYPILVRTGYNRTIDYSAPEYAGVPIYQDLAEAVSILLEKQS